MLDYNIVLIGFMGTGKSTVASYLHSVYAMDMMEMDQEIERREQMSISDIFKIKGEAYFRRRETELLREVSGKNNIVISCGGGTPMREENVIEMKKNGRVVLLVADPETILERVRFSENRPLLQGKKNVEAIRELMEERRAKYEAAADIIVDTEKRSMERICREIIEKITGMDENHV